jgi:hypothetical protein
MTRPDSAVAIEKSTIPRRRSALGSVHVQRQKRFRERCSEGVNVAEHPPPSKWGRSDRLDWSFCRGFGCSFLILALASPRLQPVRPRLRLWNVHLAMSTSVILPKYGPLARTS